MAGALWAGDDAAVSHLTAAVLWGFDGAATTEIELTVPYERSPRHPAVRVHRTEVWPPMDRDVLHGIPITSPARTLVDIAGVLRGEALEAVVEDAFRRGLCRPAFLEWRLDDLGGKGRPGAGSLRAILAERGRDVAAAESRLEVKLWRLLVGSRLPRPVRQHRVTVGGRVLRLDFAWPSVLVALEADGFDAHGGRRAFVRDRQRLAGLSALGWRVLPVSWDQVTSEPDRLLGVLEAMLHSPSLKPSVRKPHPQLQ
jgi:very-short-patch-repair endonuclease